MKRKAQQVDTKKKAPEKKAKYSSDAKSIIKIGIPYTIFAVLVICIVAILQYYFVVVGPSAKKTQIFVNTALSSYVDSILVKLDTSQDLIDRLAKNRRLVTATIDRDETELSNFEQEIASRVPYALGARVVFPDVIKQDLESTPPITNAVLDSVRNISRNKSAHPEVIGSGKPNEFVALLSPIKNGDKVVGIILVGLDIAVVDETIKKIHRSPGYIEIWQTFYDQDQVVGSEGDASFKQGSPFAIGTGQNSNWKVAFWPADVAEFSGQKELIFFIAGVIIILFSNSLVNYFGLRTVQQNVRSDTGDLAKALLDSKTSLSSVINYFRIDYFRDLIITLDRSGSNLARGSRSLSKDSSTSNSNHELDISSDAPAQGVGDSLTGTYSSSNIKVPHTIFRAYDIRGIVDDQLTPDVVRQIGKAIGSEAYDRGEQKVVVARDGRLSGPSLVAALIEGLRASGRDVVDIGEVPTPILYFATNYLDTRTGVMLTGSHNPANYNGLKMVIAGETLSGDRIQQLYQRIRKEEFVSGKGTLEKRNLIPDYLGQITGDVALAQPLKVAVDCGNGVAGSVVPRLLQGLGCEVIGLYCDVDGNFPNHHPDPSKPENLKDLIEMVKSEEADLGLAFDGDGDRLGVVTSDGNIVWPDRQMMLYAIDVLSRNPGADVIFDIKCTRHLPKVISAHGGRPIMWKTGHSFMKAKMKETGALLAGECSGHIFFKERWYGFDDALYTAARLLEILAGDVRSSAEVFEALPNAEATPEINIAISDSRKFEFVNKLAKVGEFPSGNTNTIDGIRVDFDDGWGLVRASNTTPNLVIRFEADTQDGLRRIQDLFRSQLLRIDSSLQIPF